MMGTSFSVTAATRCTPPRKMNAASDRNHDADDPGGDAKGRAAKARPMELDWTMLPMKPSARVMAMAKKHSQERAEAVR